MNIARSVARRLGGGLGAAKVAAMAVVMLLAACGQKGPLTLQPQTVPPAVAASAAASSSSR